MAQYNPVAEAPASKSDELNSNINNSQSSTARSLFHVT